MRVSANKSRTSISISPNLLRKAKTLCEQQATVLERKYSFSEMVTTALKSHIAKLERKNKDSNNGVVESGYRPHV